MTELEKAILIATVTERERCIAAVVSTCFEASDNAPVSALRQRIIKNIMKGDS